MLKTDIQNPQVNSLLSRVRHTNLLVIADRGFLLQRSRERLVTAREEGCTAVLFARVEQLCYTTQQDTSEH
jgi:D-ribose pyranose/furanose isomerase RbsD